MIRKEVWRKVKLWNGMVLVSNLGRVYTKSRISTYIRNGKVNHRLIRGRIRKTPTNKILGYPEVWLTHNGRHEHWHVHRLVAETFIPNPENKPEVNHKNGVKTDNWVENLEWVTYSEQRFHSYKMGLQKSLFGSKHPHAKLTEKNIPEIRKRLKLGEIARTIAKDFGVSIHSIYGIKHNKAWKHVK